MSVTLTSQETPRSRTLCLHLDSHPVSPILSAPCYPRVEGSKCDLMLNHLCHAIVLTTALESRVPRHTVEMRSERRIYVPESNPNVTHHITSQPCIDFRGLSPFYTLSLSQRISPRLSIFHFLREGECQLEWANRPVNRSMTVVSPFMSLGRPVHLLPKRYVLLRFASCVSYSRGLSISNCLTFILLPLMFPLTYSKPPTSDLITYRPQPILSNNPLLTTNLLPMSVFLKSFLSYCRFLKSEYRVECGRTTCHCGGIVTVWGMKVVRAQLTTAGTKLVTGTVAATTDPIHDNGDIKYSAEQVPAVPAVCY